MLNEKEIFEVGTLILNKFPVRKIISSFRVSTHTITKFRNRMNQIEMSQDQWKKIDPEARRLMCYPEAKRKLTTVTEPEILETI
ncbi:hypothetical protein [Ileibacterium valens]|uniref:hypothetical protein n=1 Tax=Ileibacterium valens TaxID=1862668 RepID=UPI0025B73C73|nr:hypothetical protein [Ileibacterium valens]